MTEVSLIEDVFCTMPDRYLRESARRDLFARIGFDVDNRKWTLVVEGQNCRVDAGLDSELTAMIKTSSEEWIAISSGASDPTLSFINKRLTVNGDLTLLLEVFALFSDYKSDAVKMPEPSWILDTLGPHWGVDDNGHFTIEKMDCAKLAATYGTPLFVTSENQFRDNYRQMKAAFEKAYPENDCNVMWAIKSNTTLALRKIMNNEGAGGDCFSAGEVYATFITGGDPEVMLLNGSNRTEETFRMALEIGMRITLDHIEDLPVVARLAKELNTNARVFIRLKCELPSLEGVASTFAPGIPVSLGVKALKFGVTFDEAVKIAAEAKHMRHVMIEGLHSHIGRDVHQPEHWCGYSRDMVRMAANFRRETGVTVPIIDLGGGISEKRDPSGNDLTHLAEPVEAYAQAIGNGIRAGCGEFDFPPPRLWVEPGRHLVGSTTALITRVGNVKKSHGIGHWVHIDGSINHLQAIEHFNGMTYHIIPGTRARAKAEEVVDIVGPNCAGDMIQLKRRLPRFERGDLLVMLDVGAYNISYANQFNCLPRPAMCLVNGEKVSIIRERESITDVFARQRMPDWLLRP